MLCGVDCTCTVVVAALWIPDTIVESPEVLVINTGSMASSPVSGPLAISQDLESFELVTNS